MTTCNIMIPTYNRPNYLRRILNYYNECGRDYNIIVADSSLDKNKKQNEKIISSFSNPNISHLSDYCSKFNVFHKIADAINYVEEKYCVVCADDDFITPNGINQSVDFLEKNPDFTVAHGYYIGFWVETDKKGKQKFCWAPTYSYGSMTCSDPKSRLTGYLSNYLIPTFYAVHRTDFLKMIFEETLKFTNDYRFGELLPSILTLIYGNMKCLDVLYGARERTPNSGGRTYETLGDFIKARTYDEKYAKFRECLSTHLSKKSQLDVEESKRVVDDSMSAYMKKYYSKDYKNILIHKMSNILNYLRLPDWMDEGIRSLYRKLFVFSKQIRMDDFQRSVDNSSSKYYDDFSKIRRHVLSYAKKR